MIDLSTKLSRLTARLDHMVPDPDLTPEENQIQSEKLALLSSKLHQILPDSSLSPSERLERLARVVEGRAPLMEHLTPASKKVEQLIYRLDELVPEDIPAEQKIDRLIDLATQAVPDENLTVVARLEKLGDIDAGINPVV